MNFVYVKFHFDESASARSIFRMRLDGHFETPEFTEEEKIWWTFFIRSFFVKNLPLASKFCSIFCIVTCLHSMQLLPGAGNRVMQQGEH